MEQLTTDTFLTEIPNTHSYALVTMNSSVAVSQDIGGDYKVTYGKDKSAKVKEWGKGNDQPMRREQLISENNIVPELVRTKRDIIIGGGLIAYKERYEAGKLIMDFVETPTEAIDFFEQADTDRFFINAGKNLVMHSNIFGEYIRDKGGRIIGMKSLESRHTRAERMDVDGVIKNYYWRGNWKPKGNEVKDFPTTQVPAYLGEAAKQSKFLIHSGDDILTDEYYYIPTWWGGKNWIELSNIIPEFHKANLKHGYTLRYHIEIPKDYFSSYSSYQQTPGTSGPDRQKVIDNEKAAKQEFIEKLNKFLAGIENTGRALITEYEINRAAGKEFPGIKIHPLSVDLKDEALLKLFEKSNQANISAQGIHPTLAAIETQGKLSSGSEIRNAFLMYVAIKTPIFRQILMKYLNPVRIANNWDKTIKYTFKDIEITKLDEDKSGSKDVAIQ